MNSNAPDNREKEIFEQALDLAGAERLEFVRNTCGENASLCARVLALLQAHESDAEFLPEEPKDQATTLLPVTEKVGDKIGHYRLREKIGEGGCGIVYVAEQEEPVRRRVALKVIKLGMDTREVVARFEAERQALALMDHPNIAKVFDAGVTGIPLTRPSDTLSPAGGEGRGEGDAALSAGRPYFVMELVRGVRITEFCDQHQLPTVERLKLFIQVCHAIQHAHQKGIIHRDIKPSNILVSLNDDVPVPKVIDFGIAKAIGERLTDKTLYTRFEQFIGTPAYMSPEQAGRSDLDIDTRTDIYALGVLLYELLAGRPPFDPKQLAEAGLEEMVRCIREEEPLRPSTRLSKLQKEELTTTAQRRGTEPPKLISLLRGDLDWIVMKCLEKNRTRRYEAAHALVRDIEAYLNHEVVMARPPSRAYRLGKFVRRNKVMVVATSAVALALVLGIAVSSWQMVAANRARDAEKQQRLEARRLLYASDMNLAQQALKLNNLGKARRLLDRHRPQPGEEDLRGWEWRYLWQLTRSSALITLTNRPVRGWTVNFSPDGTRLAVGWGDGRVELWDVPGRQLIRAMTGMEQSGVGRVAFSPVRNLLAATPDPKLVTLYDLDSGRDSILWRAPDRGKWNVRDVTFSQDGSKAVIYAGSTSPELGDAVWVVNVSSAVVESCHLTAYSWSTHFGAAQLSPDNQRLYLARSDSLNSRYSIQCLDLVTGQELWQTKSERDFGLSTFALSPDGRVLASASGFEDTTIRVWDATTGRFIVRLYGHTGWVCRLAFNKDGRRLISAASDQTIRFWDTGTWTETRVLRGHTDEVQALAISDSTQLLASVSKDGDLTLWKEGGTSSADGYIRLPGDLQWNEVLPLDHSRVLMLPRGKPPEMIDLKRDSPPILLPGIEASADVLGSFGSNLLCHWNGTNQILVRELRGAEFFRPRAIPVDSDIRPSGTAFSVTRQLLAWTEGTSSASVFVADLATPGRRIELSSDARGLVPYCFSADGTYLAALGNLGEPRVDSLRAWPLRAWNLETGQIVASINETILDAAFAANGPVLVVAIRAGIKHEIRFHDLAHPDRAPQRLPGKLQTYSLAVSPDGVLVASSTQGGLVRLFDPGKGELIDSIHGHLNAVFGLAFSADGRCLISASGGREAVKLWDVRTRQELLTLDGTGSMLIAARWSADEDVILAGPPWQAWRAPPWEEIAAAESQQTKDAQPR